MRQASVRLHMVVERGEEPLLTSIISIVRQPEEISFYEYEGENRKFEHAIEILPFSKLGH
jgi:hypothetical protein